MLLVLLVVFALSVAAGAFGASLLWLLLTDTQGRAMLLELLGPPTPAPRAVWLNPPPVARPSPAWVRPVRTQHYQAPSVQRVGHLDEVPIVDMYRPASEDITEGNADAFVLPSRDARLAPPTIRGDDPAHARYVATLPPARPRETPPGRMHARPERTDRGPWGAATRVWVRR